MTQSKDNRHERWANTVHEISSLVVKKTDVGTGSYKYKYHKFEDIVASIAPILKNNGFYITYTQEMSKDSPASIKISHGTYGSGEFPVIAMKAVAKDGATGEIVGSSCMLMPPMVDVRHKNYNHDVGATTTYCKRYALLLLLGVSLEEDTDGVTKEHREREERERCEQKMVDALDWGIKYGFYPADYTLTSWLEEKGLADINSKSMEALKAELRALKAKSEKNKEG